LDIIQNANNFCECEDTALACTILHVMALQDIEGVDVIDSRKADGAEQFLCFSVTTE
jgi:hypothetical protein